MGEHCFWTKFQICLWVLRPNCFEFFRRKRVYRVGSTKSIDVDVRILVASNQDLRGSNRIWFVPAGSVLSTE